MCHPVYVRPDARRREPEFVPSKLASSLPRANAQSAPGSRPVHVAPGRGRIAAIQPLAFAAVLALALWLGWRSSEEGYLTPETGLGYWLGIAGASLMLLLLLYPLRKRLKILHGLGSVSGWFRLHMILGLIGPAVILFHSNFKLGSLNSNVALFAMLTVAASGLIGRYLYSQIHLGLYGRRAEIRELIGHVKRLKNAIAGGLALPDDLVAALDAYAMHAIGDRRGPLSSFVALLGVHLRSPAERARLLKEAQRHIRIEGKSRGWSRRMRREWVRQVRRLLRQYFAAVGKAAAFAFYERLFALWHVLHLPFFILLVLAAIVHVVAVHLY